MIRASGHINDPSLESLKLYAAITELGAVLKALQSDPKFIEKLGGKIMEAFVLSQEEMETRDTAAKLVAEAASKYQETLAQCEALKAEARESKALADSHVAQVKGQADTHRKIAEEAIASGHEALDARHKELARMHGNFIEREAALNKAEADNQAASTTLKNKEASQAAFAEELSKRLASVTEKEKKLYGG